jgi:putative heme-binding domain-containing protein
MAPSAAHRGFLMKGFEEAYRGRPMVGLPDELLEALASSGQTPLILRVRQGDTAAGKEALAIVQNRKADLADRLLYARTLGELQREEAVPVLLRLAADNEPAALRKAALVSLMNFNREDVGANVAALLPKVDGEIRTAALALLASRAPWSVHLLQAVDQGTLEAATVPDDIVQRMRGHDDSRVAELLAKRYPPVAAASGIDFNQRIADVEAALKQGTGNPYAGEAVFNQRCAACHKLFFKGGRIGPDLTSYQRDNLGTMLISIVNPNAEIREGFEYHQVETRDGRSLSGFLVERDLKIVVLRGLEGEDITLPQSEIKALRPVGRSLMPEGLLDNLDGRQLRDLFAYLRISQPITR